MAFDSRRPDRVAEGIREVVATFLTEDVKDPRISGLVTVTGVDVPRDMRQAKIFVSVMGSDEERAKTFEGLKSVALHLRGKLGRALRLRHAPELIFLPDDSIARAARIEELLAGVRESTPPAPEPAMESEASTAADVGTDTGVDASTTSIGGSTAADSAPDSEGESASPAPDADRPT